jgi:hypothetical protein
MSVKVSSLYRLYPLGLSSHYSCSTALWEHINQQNTSAQSQSEDTFLQFQLLVWRLLCLILKSNLFSFPAEQHSNPCMLHAISLLSDYDSTSPQNCHQWLQWTDKLKEYTESCDHILFISTGSYGQKPHIVNNEMWDECRGIWLLQNSSRQVTWDHSGLHQSLTL